MGIDKELVNWYADLCCPFTSLLRKKWHPTTTAKLDAFHFLQRLLRSCSSEKHPAYADFACDLASALMPLVAEDFDFLVNQVMLALNLDKRAAVASLTKKQLKKFVRRFIPAPALLEERIQSVFDLYSTMEYEGVLLFTNKTWVTYRDCLEHVRKGCLFDKENCPLYKKGKVLKNGLIVWKSLRGTSQLEGFHAYQVGDFFTSSIFFNFIECCACRSKFSKPIKLHHLWRTR